MPSAGRDEVELRFDLPGIDIESLDVTVDRGVLTVSAKRSRGVRRGREAVPAAALHGFLHPQRPAVRRVDAEQIEADYEGGVLKVRVPLTEQAQPRKVEVKAPGSAELSA